MWNETPSEETRTSKSIDSVTEETHDTIIPEEFLNTIEISGLPPHVLKLKKHAVIILLRNMNVSDGHCNGSRYIIERVSKYFIGASKLQTNKQILIPKISLFSKTSDYPFVMRRL